MKYLLLNVIILMNVAVFSQNSKDSTLQLSIPQVNITANKIPVALKLSTSSVSIVTTDVLTTMPRTIAADEALKFVPGVRIDNQANGSRLHMSIRGQGILSERGLRGIKIMIDGIPVNDPTGFAADLYDVDWETVRKIEVLRGSSTALFGGCSSAGVLNIETQMGGTKRVNGKALITLGSNAFYKVLGQVNGSSDKVDYRVSVSRMQGDGYRKHTAFWGNNISEKLAWKPTEKLTLQQVLTITDYFNQNAEGLSLDQVKQDPLQANGDANLFNEYQKTNRFTNGLTGNYAFSKNSDIDFYGFMRWSNYKETSNKCAQYRNFIAPGGLVQYNLHIGNEGFKNQISIGSEFQWQKIAENKFISDSIHNRTDDIDETNIEGDLLANQYFTQRSVGFFIADQLTINQKLNITASIRQDYMYNKLDDKVKVAGHSLSGEKNFNNLTFKLGAAYSINEGISLYTCFSQGFIPPATEELANNPDTLSFSGFNKNLKPASSVSGELGLRGAISSNLYFDVCAFMMNTKDDYYRYKIPEIFGNQTVFYGNKGDSKRYGLETFIMYNPIQSLDVKLAYTYSHFQYVSPDDLKDVWLPNSPEHQVSVDAGYTFLEHFSAGLTYEMQSKWYIYSDADHKDLSQDGFSMLHARLGYEFKTAGLNWEVSAFMKNILDEKYIAFTEPDPDGNCYQPGSGREIFASIKVRF